jgi:dTDP-4-amino-4,6-dideoxygalactose transaminase
MAKAIQGKNRFTRPCAQGGFTVNSVAVRSIPFFNYPSLFLNEEAQLVEIFRDVGRRGAFILQQDLVEFESNLTKFLGAGQALGVGNATDGLIIALRAALRTALPGALNPAPGVDPPAAEIIFSSHTMVATAAAIHFAGAIPVPVECGPDHLIDPGAVDAAITPRTCAILPTQLNGRTADMNALQTIAARHGLIIVEDAAQALGSRFKGGAAATFGAAAVISFFPAKLLGCLGDGGAVIANHFEVNGADVYDRMLQLRDHGRRADGTIVSWGLNSRLDNLQAAILDDRLRSYPQVIERRRAQARLYRQRLGELEELVLPPGPDGDPDHFDVYQNYEIEAPCRDLLREFLHARGIGTSVPWGGKAVHQWPGLGFSQHLPFTEQLFERLLLLPLNLSLSSDDLHQVCDAIYSFYRG